MYIQRKYFLWGGVNNCNSTDYDGFKTKYDSLFTTIRDSIPDAVLYVESMLPLNPSVYNVYCNNEKVKRVNAILKSLAEKHGLTYIDLFSIYQKDGILPMDLSKDGIHLKPECYDKWANAIAQYIYE